MTKQPHPTRERVALIVAGAVIIVCAMALYGIISLRTEQRDEARQESGTNAERAETAEQYAAGVAAKCKRLDEAGAALRAQGVCPTAQKIADKSKADPILVAGTPGRDGTDGTDGRDGQDGQDGTDGRDGEDGADGAVGPGIKTSDVNSDGDLILTYTDGTVINAGRVRGTDGKDGTSPDLTGYATEDWVRALIRALGCSITVAGNGPPLVLDCAVTGKP